MKLFRGFALVLIIAAIAGFGYWQWNKQVIIKNTISKTIQKKTDSLYLLHYDSAQIDEVNGNAAFYKITLLQDTTQLKLIKQRDGIPKYLVTVKVKEIKVKGIDMAGLLKQQRVAAHTIVLINPVITLTNTGSNKSKSFNAIDTLELYQKIIGKFNSIHADTIRVIGGAVYITDKKGKMLTSLQNINITLNKFLVDSTKNYQHIIGYFIKDVNVTIGHVELPTAKNGSNISINNLVYNAPEKSIQVKEILQIDKSHKIISQLKNILVSGLNTDEFIVHQHLKATQLSSEGGLITVFKSKRKTKLGEEGIELSADLIDEVQVKSIELGNTDFNIIDPLNPAETPFKIREVKFSATNIMSISRGSLLSDLINNSYWNLYAGSFVLLLKQKRYQIKAKYIVVNSVKNTVTIKQFLLQPMVTQQQWIKINKTQKDRMDMVFNNLSLTGINIKQLVSKGFVEIETLTMEPLLKIYNDRTLPVDTSSRLGKYPNQSLVKLAVPFFCKQITVKNGAVFYTEKGLISKQEGGPEFTNIQAVIYNVTNMPDKIKANSTMQMKANALFMGVGKLNTQWVLPLNKKDSIITITGSLGKLNATVINTITEPLGLVQIKTGTIQQLLFNLTCTNFKGEGSVSFLYNNLTVKLLKPTAEGLQSRGLLTVLANTIVKNNNPVKGKTPYLSKVSFNRDISTSIFNLIWKTILQGVKKTAAF